MSVPSTQDILQYLSGFAQQGGERWLEENVGYLNDHVHRFHQTLKFIPVSRPGEKLLELGSSPFFLTLLLEQYMDYQLTLTDISRNDKQSSVKLVKAGEERTFVCDNFNVEIDRFPYPDNNFDVVLCCELIEHLILDPTHMLLEIHRVLKPGGTFVITTPNVTALGKLVSLVKNRNI